MAWQGSAYAASQRLPRVVITGVHTHITSTSCRTARPGEGSARHRVGGDRRRRKLRGNHPQISLKRKLPSNPIGGGVEGVGVTVLPQASAAEANGAGRNGRATAAAINVRPSLARKRGEERGRLGWVGLTDPDPSRVGSIKPGGLVWA
jgi:hypothetical protein